jgi:hypothetical protein
MPLLNTYNDNISNLLPLNDYGIKIAKIGFDANTAADKDLVYNSSWPSIQIVKVIDFDNTVFKFTHGLTFPPFALIIRPDGFRTMESLPVDDVSVYVDNSFNFGDGKIIIYNIDLSKDVDYPYTTQQSSNVTYSYDYGIKVAKNGNNIDSNDMRDYILHTRCGSPLVLAVKTQETANPLNPNVVQYTSKVGYPTLNFGYIKITGPTFGVIPYTGNTRYFPAPLQSQAYPITYTNGITTNIPFGTTTINGELVDNGATLVILRNPSISLTNSVSEIY